jgi:hypothetical protein
MNNQRRRGSSLIFGRWLAGDEVADTNNDWGYDRQLQVLVSLAGGLTKSVGMQVRSERAIDRENEVLGIFTCSYVKKWLRLLLHTE